MRIAVVSTINLPTPPAGYGGIERLVYWYAEELVRQGHEVTLFGRTGSHCSGRTIEVTDSAAQAPSSGGKVRLSEESLYRCMRDHFAAEPPDVIHDWSLQNLYVNRHPDTAPFIVSTCVPQPADYAQRNVVAASAAHAATLKDGKVPFVRFGIDVDNLPFSSERGTRLVQVAKIARYKGQHLAMLAAALARKPLDVVGNVEGQRYYRLIVRPLAALLPMVRLTGETFEVDAVLRSALALVLTPQWFETFPLVSLQAMAAGTPVLTLASGGLPEQIEEGINGFVANGVRELAGYMRRVEEIDRRACRAIVEERFHVRRMVHDYIRLYERVRDRESW
jgi:glycosyltransferase involved in cell wall biosynthesis